MKEMKWLNDKFLKIADFVSFGMGTPTNIIFWILAVVVWFVLGVTRPALFNNANFLPSWFTSTAWNFPLNTITTLAELYIGFLVAAATNRAERELRKIIEEIKNTVEEVKKINSNQNKILELLVDYQKKELAEDKKIIKDVESIKKS
jgi:low affinity Fe/Cu permease